jgi:hypothetical protein
MMIAKCPLNGEAHTPSPYLEHRIMAYNGGPDAGVRQFVRLSSAATPSNSRKRSTVDEAITAKDGAWIFYKEWENSQSSTQVASAIRPHFAPIAGATDVVPTDSTGVKPS